MARGATPCPIRDWVCNRVRFNAVLRLFATTRFLTDFLRIFGWILSIFGHFGRPGYGKLAINGPKIPTNMLFWFRMVNCIQTKPTLHGKTSKSSRIVKSWFLGVLSGFFPRSVHCGTSQRVWTAVIGRRETIPVAQFSNIYRTCD